MIEAALHILSSAFYAPPTCEWKMAIHQQAHAHEILVEFLEIVQQAHAHEILVEFLEIVPAAIPSTQVYKVQL